MTPPSSPRRGGLGATRPPCSTALLLPLLSLLVVGDRLVPSASSIFASAAATDDDDATAASQGGGSGSSGSSNKCGLYLAPSSTNPDEDEDALYSSHPPKLGLYAGRTYSPLDVIGHPEIAIQVYDMEGHTGRTALSPAEKGEYDDDDGDENGNHPPVEPDNVNHFRYAVSHLWTSDSTGAKYDTSEHTPSGHGHTYTSIPGVGMLGNFHPGVMNADWNQRSCHDRRPQTDAAGADAAEAGRVHPGRGASSEYYNVTVRATRSIPAGMEIFMDFGAEWSRENTEEGEATEEDYDRADKSIGSILKFMEKYDRDLSPGLASDIYDFLLNDVVPLGSESEERGEIQRSLLPKDVTKLKAVRDTGGSLRHHNPSVFRDLAWLEENGQCMDNIYPGPSTIPYAGRGAFAARRLSKGDLVSPMPLVHIPHRRELDTYDLIEGLNDKVDEHDENYEALVREGGKNAKPTGKQLLLNYCFAHPASNVLLYPFGTVSNFINHQPGGRANAKIVWSSSASSTGGGGGGLKIHRPEWLNVPPSELSDTKYDHVGLAFDVVATRDVRPGEEVFLDYGTEWQEAWDRHVAKFNEAEEAKDGDSEAWVELTALEMNARYHGRRSPPASSSSSSGDIEDGGADGGNSMIRPFRVPREVRRDPYPDRVTTSCHISYREIDEDADGAVPDDEKFVDGFKAYQWTDASPEASEGEDEDEASGGSSEDVWKGASMRLCEIVERIPLLEDSSRAPPTADDDDDDDGSGSNEAVVVTSYNYTARVTLEADSDDSTDVKVVRGIPHAAVRFVDRPYEGEQHRSGAFRAPIGIPDEIFPEAWKDREE